MPPAKPTQSLLYDMVHRPEALRGVVTFSHGLIAPLPGARYHDEPVAGLLEMLGWRGALEVVVVSPDVPCSACGSDQFVVLLHCGVHGIPIVLRSDPRGPDGVEGSPPAEGPTRRIFHAVDLGDLDEGPPPSRDAQEAETPPLDLSEFWCEECRGPPLSVVRVLRCLDCRSELRMEEAAVTLQPLYRVVSLLRSPVESVVEAAKAIFQAQGFTVESPARVPGRSGVIHEFDLMAKKDGSLYAIDVETTHSEAGPGSRPGRARASWATDPSAALIGYRAKILDVGSGARPLLLVVPSLDPGTRQMAQALGLEVLESPDVLTTQQFLLAELAKPHRTAPPVVSSEALDSLLTPGPGERGVTLVLGDPGSGKTLLALQFLMAGVRRRQRGLLVLTCSTAEEVFRMADTVGLELRTPLRRGEVTVLEVAPLLGQKKPKGLDDTAQYRRFFEHMISELASHAAEVRAERVAIDTLTPLTPVRRYEELRQLFGRLGGLAPHVLVTKERAVDGEPMLEENFAPRVVSLHAEMNDGRPRRTLIVQKRTASGPAASTYSYRIARGAGVALQPLASAGAAPWETLGTRAEERS